jgi:hypothetical protein
MGWYKYWYYTIFFIYDSFCKNQESNKGFAVALFSICTYIIITLTDSLLYILLDYGFMKNLCHIYSHLLLFTITYLFNGFLFWPERKARKERGIYREINKQSKNLFFIILTIIIFAAYFYMLFNYREYFLLIY